MKIIFLLLLSLFTLASAHGRPPARARKVVFIIADGIPAASFTVAGRW